MVTETDLREALTWVGEVRDLRRIDLVFDHGGRLDAHYQVDAVYKHTATALSAAEVESLQAVRAEYDMWVETSGDTDAGRSLTLSGVADTDVDAHFAVVVDILGSVYGVGPADVERIDRHDWR